MPRNLALEALNKFDNSGTFPAFSLQNGFQYNKELSSRDRALVVHLVQGVLRWRRRIDWIIRKTIHFPFKRLDPIILNILRVAVYQIFFMDRIPDSAAVNEAVKQAKQYKKPHLVGFVNGILREIVRQKDALSYPDTHENLIWSYSVLYSYPEWMVEKWINEFGVDFAVRLMKAGNEMPSIVLRANILKTQRDSVIGLLKEEGIEGEPTPYSPWGVKLKGLKRPVADLRCFKKGLVYVQGEAAQLVSAILGVKPKERVLDVCAGLGGKTTHLAEISGDKAFITATDIKFGNLVKLKKSGQRLGLRSIYPVVSDAGNELLNLFKVKFEKILVDAPCSGLGVISRHPDIKWTRKLNDLERLASLQKRILFTASKFLAEGGRLLYITCTISREENEGVVEAFLNTSRGMRLQDIGDIIPGWRRELVDENGFFRTYPHIHGMDGFFGALFCKI